VSTAVPLDAEATEPPRGRALEVLGAATRLGLTSFGGPVAHLGYFRHEYVERRRWLSDELYADIVALCQALPGPASSQVGMAVGYLRAGYPGALLAWIGFTIPSAFLMVAFAYGLDALGDVEDDGWLHGLKIAAVAVVALAVWGMARTLAPDRPRATIAIAAAVVVLAWQTALVQLGVIVVSGLVGWRLLGAGRASRGVGRRGSMAWWQPAFFFAAFLVLLVLLPIAREATGSHALAVFDSLYRTGALVFGGGHVVLPLLQAEVVEPGWVSESDFVAGYGAAQAVPGPLFTFSAYLGAVMVPEPNGVAGASLALIAVFLPSFLLVLGGLPMWTLLRGIPALQSALRGVNAAVVGLLLAALYNPVWTSAIFEAKDLALAVVCFGLLAFWRLPPWVVVVFAAAGGQALASL
jgi:chromate transporter